MATMPATTMSSQPFVMCGFRYADRMEIQKYQRRSYGRTAYRGLEMLAHQKKTGNSHWVLQSIHITHPKGFVSRSHDSYLV